MSRFFDPTRALLDQLMGPDRNLTLAQKLNSRSSIHWNDTNKVCYHFVVGGFCTQELFQGTKMDRGTCYKQHDSRLRQDFLRENIQVRSPHENRFYQLCKGMIDEVDNRLHKEEQQQQQQLLLQSNTSNTATTSTTSTSSSAVNAPSSSDPSTVLSHFLSHDPEYLSFSVELSQLQPRISTLQEQIQVMTASLEPGSSSPAITAIHKMCADLEAQKAVIAAKMDQRREQLEKDAQAALMQTTANGDAAHHPSLSVPPPSSRASAPKLFCDVCGSSMVVGDNEARMAHHRAGKFHMAYERLREFIQEYKERKQRGEINDDTVIINSTTNANNTAPQTNTQQTSHSSHTQHSSTHRYTSHHITADRDGAYRNRDHSRDHHHQSSRDRDVHSSHRFSHSASSSSSSRHHRSRDPEYPRHRSRSKSRSRSRSRSRERERDRDRERDRQRKR